MIARVEDWRRRLNLLAAPEILRISPEPLLRAAASAIALWLSIVGVATRGSGSCSGVGGCDAGRLRPRGPSGDDWSEGYAGVDELEGP